MGYMGYLLGDDVPTVADIICGSRPELSRTWHTQGSMHRAACPGKHAQGSMRTWHAQGSMQRAVAIQSNFLVGWVMHHW